MAASNADIDRAIASLIWHGHEVPARSTVGRILESAEAANRLPGVPCPDCRGTGRLPGDSS